MTTERLTWQEIVETCSRLHTTRKRPWIGGEMREGSEMLPVIVAGRPATIVPTRMHEPGFYWRYEGMAMGDGIKRSDDDIEELRMLVEAGHVRRAGDDA